MATKESSSIRPPSASPDTTDDPAVSLSATLAGSNYQSTHGTIPFTVAGEVYETWYKIFGDIGHGPIVPLVVAHGGPGLSHDYLLPLGDLSSERPVIFYDQIGNSRSTRLNDKPQSFWTIDLFVEELDNLLRHFGIQDRFDLLGHSWGGILGMEYEVRRRPTGMRHLILSNSLASMALWDAACARLLSEMPKDTREVITKGPADDRVTYRAAMLMFYAAHGCIVKPMPKEFLYSLDRLLGPEGDSAVSNAMFGGELKEWNIIPRLGEILVPILVINGRADISMDSVIKPLVEGISGSQVVTFEDSSHTPWWEERERYMEVIRRFLNN
ncbi:hypothetical protein DXG01_013296 [Tephrocybe rancida]|nr:hypothetical protein DXG01_013296 [Tephrocybe rancida]